MKIDKALHSLDRGSTTDQRMAVLGQLVDYWHSRRRTGDGYTDKDLGGMALPKPLRWWYRFAGQRESSAYNQIVLQAPSELRPDADGRVVFYIENQGVYLWSITPDGDDPPVWGRFQQANVPWSAEGMPLSEFLIGACLFQAIMDSPCGAAVGWAEPTILRKITKVLPPTHRRV